MRFFRFLHRRTKSDSAISNPTPAAWDHILKRPQSLDAAQTAIPICPQTFLFPTPADASNAIFELETTNSRLRRDISAWALECEELRTRLDAIQTDLFAQLHKNSMLQRQVQADRLETDGLHGMLAKYERFLSLMINVGLHRRVLGDAHAALRAGVDPDVALVDAIKEAAAIPGSAWSTIIPSITGPRTTDEYRASLNMTLRTRKELRESKKIAKFWRRIAVEHAPSGTVTPSVSSISSIHEPLPPERQQAVEELIAARRRASHASQEVANESSEHSIPSCSSSNSSLSADITPSTSGSEPAPLSPLASESFKTEVAGLSSYTRLFKRGPAPVSKQNRPVLAQLDTNVPSKLSHNRGQRRNKRPAQRGIDLRNENAPQVQEELDPASEIRPHHPEFLVANVVPSFSKHSLCSAHLGPLGRIEEEREESLMTEPPEVTMAIENAEAEGVANSSWSVLDLPGQDLSFSFCDIALSTPPQKAEIATPIKTSSRLPMPVLKQLNRMSLTKKLDKPQVAGLAIRKKSASDSSATHLPLSAQAKRTHWRA